ncbi:MAG: hypothetical protein R3D84_05680 [Paracoccaceae bacterium]
MRFSRLFPALILALVGPGIATAGGWPREKGAFFASTSVELARSGNSAEMARAGLFAEYGLGRGFTLGLDVGRGAGDADALVSLRKQLVDTRFGTFSLGIGAGTRKDAWGTTRVMRPEISWGKGFDTRFGQAWFGLDAARETRSVAPGTAHKLDATLGLKPRDGLMLILQAQAADYPGSDPTMRLQASTVWEFGDTGRKLEIAPLIGVRGDVEHGLKIGLWTEF